MNYFKEKLYPASVKRKIIAGFLLVFVAILLALSITHIAFREMMDTVDKLSTPNKELNALNVIFQEITTLDQVQRAEAIKNPRSSYKSFLTQSKSLIDKIDSLRMMEWDSAQQVRLLALRKILTRRNQFFFSYLTLKSELLDNRSLTHRLDTLARILEHEKIVFDTSVVTTEKKTVTTYSTDSSESQKDDRSRLGKLFGGKKKKVTPLTTHVKVQEELRVIVDTLSIARQNKALEEVEKIIIDLENDQQEENRKLLREELELIHANSLLINQLLSILHEVENEEMAKMQQNNDRAAALVTLSNSRITTLLIVFFVGAALLVYLIWVDITRSNYYKAQLEKAKDEAVELSQIKQRFLANMSHEIRTPLQSIIGFSEQLKRGNANPEAVAAINNSSEHLLQIVDEILDYSRISNGSFALSKENFPLVPLIKEVTAALKIQADRKGLSLLVELDKAGDFTVRGDPFRLRQILYNLMGNAIKFTSNGYVKLSLKTTAEENFISCVFDVSDTGIGINPEDLDRIFNKFEQANSMIARNYGGTGLGLSIVKLLVEEQGGLLKVTSDPGLGSTFSATLRFEIADAKQHDVVTTKESFTPSSARKVIVVDDDTMILRLCSLIFENNKILHVIYNDPTKVANQEPDRDVSHILIDIRMPSMSGVELCRILRSKYDPATKLVALTAHVLPQEQQELLNEGFDAVLPKPFREHELLSLFGVVPETGNNITMEISEEIDLTTLKRMTQGDEGLFQSILAQFIDETENDLRNLNADIKQLNPKVVRDVVHKLAGRIGQVGGLSLSSKLRDIENGLVNGTPLLPLMEQLSQAKDEIESLLKAVRGHVMAPSEG